MFKIQSFSFIWVTSLFIFVICDETIVYGNEPHSSSPSSVSSTSPMKIFRKVYSECEQNDDMLKCLKIQAIKLTERALKIQNIKIIDGISVLEKLEDSRSFNEKNIDKSANIASQSEKSLLKLSSKEIDQLLNERTNQFLESHQIQVSVPRLLAGGQKSGARLIEEGRKKMKKFYGPFLAAVAIKGGILAMAYHSIAIVAGKALIIGKIALIISAIIGLKKLVTPDGHEKTTYEIVKHPHVQQSHTYSSSHNEYEGGHEGGGGQYPRSFQTSDLLMQDRAYHAHQPIVVS